MFDKSIMDALGITEEMVSTEEGFYEACELVKNSGYTTENGESVIPVALHADGLIHHLMVFCHGILVLFQLMRKEIIVIRS